MKIHSRRARGMILLSSLVVAFIMMLWVVAALQRSTQQAHAVRFSHRKSEAYYLAKTGVSRALYVLNRNSSWPGSHSSKASADVTIVDNTKCWVETVDAKMVLKCEATVGAQTHLLSVPLTEIDQSDTQVYSVSPAIGGGRDQIAHTSVNTDSWQSLPPIPGGNSVVSVAGADNGDVFAVAVVEGDGQTLWRYRAGRGWIRMPDTPNNVAINSLTVSGSERLVAKGANNSVLILGLQSSLQWEQHSAPSGTDLEVVSIPVTRSERIYATGRTGGEPSLWEFDLGQGQWTQIPNPVAAHFNPYNGRVMSVEGEVPNFDGGVGADGAGNVYVASNPPGEPAVIYQKPAGSASWELFPAVPAYNWGGDESVSADTLAYKLQDLKVDDLGVVWVQWQDPNSNAFGTLRIDPTSSR